MSYKHLSFNQRCQIAAFYKVGYLQKDIALEIGVSTSTISREIKRNSRWNGVYSPEQADSFYQDRRRKSKKPEKFTKNVQEIVTGKLLLEWSPEQISGYAKRHNLFSISHERIYQYVLQDKKLGGQLFKHLRPGHRKYRKRYGRPRRKGPIKNRIWIDERPEIVEEKIRIGDWEIDTIIGKQGQKAIVTLVDRFSKFTLMSKVGTKAAKPVSEQIIKLLTPFKDKVFTVTADNGSEFAHHEIISSQLSVFMYFSHPYHSWERGLNENTNGLIRQYIPKGSDFNGVSQIHIDQIVNRLNSRPRKSLNYATPQEIFYKN